MFGLDIAMAGLLHLAAFDVQCKVKSDPKVLVQPLRSVVQYDFTKSKSQLQHFDIDTVSPYGPDHKAKVGGLMSGEIRVESRVRLMQEKYRHLNKGCIHVDTIDVIVHVNPTIFVAKEFKKGSCDHKAIIEHEKKHVRVDVETATKYAALIKEEIKAKLQSNGASFGPYSLKDMKRYQKKIQSSFDEIVTSKTQQMTEERTTLQQNIDTADEYERVSNQCR